MEHLSTWTKTLTNKLQKIRVTTEMYFSWKKDHSNFINYLDQEFNGVLLPCKKIDNSCSDYYCLDLDRYSKILKSYPTYKVGEERGINFMESESVYFHIYNKYNYSGTNLYWNISAGFYNIV